MYMTWPYFPATQALESGIGLNPAHIKRRIAYEKQNKDTTMYAHTHELQPHVIYTTERRLADARKAEQIRLARVDRRGPISSVTISLRIAIGTLLISTGERLRQDRRPDLATASLERRAASTT